MELLSSPLLVFRASFFSFIGLLKNPLSRLLSISTRESPFCFLFGFYHRISSIYASIRVNLKLTIKVLKRSKQKKERGFPPHMYERLRSSLAPLDHSQGSFFLSKTSAYSNQPSISFGWVPNPKTHDGRGGGCLCFMVHLHGSKCGPHCVQEHHR